MRGRVDRQGRRLIRKALCFLPLVLFTASPLSAWKSAVHAYLSMMARADALDDGWITIYEADYASGRFRLDAAGRPVILGRYPVDRAVLDALRRYPLQFKAGALGPDVYPDILTGQAGIHPDNSARGHSISDDWLRLIWSEALKEPGGRSLAFAAGFLTHAAGDLFGHSFINNYAGGSFALGENALKHIVLESYIDKRTPTDEPGFYDLSIEGVDDFLYRRLMVGPLTPAASASDLVDRPTYLFNYAPPRLFRSLAGFVQAIRDACQADIDAKSRDIRDALAEANRLTTADPPKSAAWAAIAAAAKVDKTALQVVMAYIQAWRKDVESGQRAWITLGHEMGKAALFNPAGFDDQRLKSLAKEYVNLHLLSMLGAPDALGENLDAMRRLREYIDRHIPQWFKDLAHFLTTDLEIWLLEKAWGVTWDYLKRPEVHFDLVLDNHLTSNTGERISLRDFNRGVLGIADDGFSTRATYDWTRVPAVANSLTMMKLNLIGRQGIERLIADLEEKGFTENGFNPLLVPGPGEVPVGLGFHGSLDRSDQWCRAPKMLFARDGCAYRKIFLRQIGEAAPPCFNACETPADGSVTTVPFERPISSGTSHPLNAVLAGGDRFRLWGEVPMRGDLPGEAPALLSYPGIRSPAAVSVGGDAILALDRSGAVWIWGYGTGLFLTGSSGPPEAVTPRPVPGLESITMVAAGLYHALALRSNGTVWSWGESDGEGQLGQGPGYHTGSPPRRVRGIGDIVAIGAGWSHSLAVSRGGEVWIWGHLGAGPDRSTHLARKVAGLTEIIAVDGGYNHSLALKKDGTVWAWGSNQFQQLGDGTAIDRPDPVQVKGLTGIVAVTAGHHFSAALTSDGGVWVWGSNDPRVLGRAQPYRIPTPMKVDGLPPIAALDAGQAHLIALDKDGAVWEWGHNWMQPKKYAR